MTDEQVEVEEATLVKPVPLSDEHRDWLESVSGLISRAEREFFLAIQQDYRRDAFIAEFWDVRDPDPTTRLNELYVRWKEYVAEAAIYFGFNDGRAVAFILNGPPGRFRLADGREVGRCYSRSKELEIWFYGASERTEESFPIIFLKRGRQRPYSAWLPGENFHAVQRSGGLPSTNIRELCADELLPVALAFIRRDNGYDLLLDEVLSPPEPPLEWLSTFAGDTTDVPRGAETFAAELELDYPGRNQNRTALQAVIAVPRSEAVVRDFDGELRTHFVVVGEVVRDGSLFETFRYRYELAVAEEVDLIPLVFTRYLRSGPVSLNLRVEDVYGGRFARLSEEVDIPTAEGLTSLRRRPDSGVFKLLAEAAEAAARGERTLRLVPPEEGSIQVGMTRFETRAVGDFDQVTFFLNEKPILTKRRPPYSVELNLGTIPATHQLRAVGFEAGSEVAMDELRINQGGQRFRVHITEPRGDLSYEQSVTTVVQVDTPDQLPIERLEIFLDEERVATLYQPPFVQSLLLPGPQLAYVRAVAYLEDGSSTEDVQFINAPDYMEEIEVQYVELHTLVVDDAGRPILDLEESSFRAFEDGQEQTIRRFEYVRNLPIHAGLLLDTSASMEESLGTVSDAALSFTRAAIEEKDRICVISFASQPEIAVRFTNQTTEVERALAGLEARGSTALYDSLVYALTYFDGVRGQKALLLLSDGKDEASSFTFEQAVEVARRSGVIVYAIGLREAFKEKANRKVLQRISRETGGEAYFLGSLEELPEVYATIQKELRSRYLLTYQSTSSKDPSEFRGVRVEVDVKGAEARSMSGLLPLTGHGLVAGASALLR